MSIICGICGNEKRYDEYHRMYRRCVLCKSTDRNFDKIKDWGCKVESEKSPCYCKNNDPVTGEVCYNLYT